MAIITEHPYITDSGEKDWTLVKTYSDEGFALIQLETGLEYSEAIDVFPIKYHYAEKIETEVDDELQHND